MATTPLPVPARYFPLESGRYEVAPAFKRWGTDFGNGAADARVLQLDTDFPLYRANKLRCRAERLSKYYTTQDYDPGAAAAVARFIVARLADEYPEHFHLQRESDSSSVLHCALTDEVLRFDPDMELLEVSAAHPLNPPYLSALDALCNQIPEDIAVVRAEPERGDWIAALHICSPSHWAAEAIIGKDFVATHAPVPGFGGANPSPAALVRAMLDKGPFVRFAWGIAPDTRLNCHPEPPPGHAPADWKQPAFVPRDDAPPFYLRVERQVIWGLPESGAAIFSIRPAFVSGVDLRADPGKCALLRAALCSMSPESRAYKNLTACMDELLSWLDGS